jgi:hypothetical protein
MDSKRRWELDKEVGFDAFPAETAAHSGETLPVNNSPYLSRHIAVSPSSLPIRRKRVAAGVYQGFPSPSVP